MYHKYKNRKMQERRKYWKDDLREVGKWKDQRLKKLRMGKEKRQQEPNLILLVKDRESETNTAKEKGRKRNGWTQR